MSDRNDGNQNCHGCTHLTRRLDWSNEREWALYKEVKDLRARVEQMTKAAELWRDVATDKAGPVIESVIVLHPCDECGGTGEVEGQIGGDDNGWGAAAALADVPMVCGLCDGEGVL